MRSMIGFLKLVRLPNAFTAIADIIAAYVIMRGVSTSADVWNLLQLALASAALYLSGMAFNDIADREEDARVRPDRPIPSGQVSVGDATVCAIGLMAGGIALAAIQGESFGFAVLLALSILAYDFGSKGITVLGPITLGFCRFFNVMMGAAVGLGVLSKFTLAASTHEPLAMALSIGIYAAGLTAFSAQEETGKQIRSIVIGWTFCGAALLLAGLSGRSNAGWIVLGPLTALLMYRTYELAKNGTPLAARNLVRTGVMGVCAVDAGLLLSFRGFDWWPAAVFCLALLGPTILIANWLAQKEA